MPDKWLIDGSSYNISGVLNAALDCGYAGSDVTKAIAILKAWGCEVNEPNVAEVREKQ